MRFAYADPPYIGCAAKYRAVDKPDAEEVDHAALVARLCDEYPDGWALSSHGKGLREVLALCPVDVEIAVWVNTAAPPQVGHRVIPVWEPVFYRGGRRRRVKGRREAPIANALVAAAATPPSWRFLGAKPAAFTFWVLGLLGVEVGDVVDDLFPGSGGVGQEIERYLLQRPLAERYHGRMPHKTVRDAIRRGHQPPLEEAP